MKRCLPGLALCIAILFLCAGSVNAQKVKKGLQMSGNRIAGTPSYTKININNISDYVYNNGFMDTTPDGDPGFEYPIGSGKTAFFCSGFLWGGLIDKYWAVGGSTYRTGLKPGRILYDGTAQDINASEVRIYRVRSDYKNFTNADSMQRFYANEIADEGKTAQQIYAQYKLDWDQWPAQYGAPYIDKNGDGVYNPLIDIPGVSEEPCQTVWYVANDLDPVATQNLYSALPMKIELQATFYAFKTSKPIGNTIFKKYKIINKNSKSIDSMYFSMWSDPDLGNSLYDLSGCDVNLNLAFIYSGKDYDETFKYTPPAAGFVTLQGPVVPSSLTDNARAGGKLKPGFKNLGMSSFYYFSGGVSSDYADPAPANYTNGALAWKNIFAGKLSRTGAPIIDPGTNQPTMYHFSGDPVRGTGWLDPRGGDKRMATVSGPFTMNPGDTQEVVYGQVIAGVTAGIDRLEAITILKLYSKTLQTLYNNNLSITAPPPAPIVHASEFDKEILLSWENAGAFEASENWTKGNFRFEGYNIYQLPNADAALTEGKRIATYDVVNNVTTIVSTKIEESLGAITNTISAYGTDSGINRYIRITEDKIKGIPSLYNGTIYYFAVTAYGYNPQTDAIPNYLESAAQTIITAPHSVNPGIRFNSLYGDNLAVNHSSGSGTGSVLLKVYNPSKVTGHNYELRFENVALSPATSQIEWFLKDLTEARDVLSNQTIYGGVDVLTGTAVGTKLSNADGLNLNVAGSLKTAPWFESATLNNSLGLLENKSGSLYREYTNHNYDLFAGYLLGTSGGTSNGYLNFPGKGSTDPAILQNDLELRWTGVREIQTIGGKQVEVVTSGGSMATLWTATNYALGDHPLNPAPGSNAPFLVRIPFEVWDVENNVQINALIRDRDGKPGDNPFQPFNLNGRMFVDFLSLPYNTATAYDPNGADLTWMKNLSWALTFWGCHYTAGDKIRFAVVNPITIKDKFTFTAPATTTDINLAKEDVNMINVFPNPYYGLSIDALRAYDAHITFNHLPARAIIKIFAVSGQLIRVLEKSDNSQFVWWDLKTDGNRDVPSGIYIAHIELPDLGKVKTLKIAVLMGQQFKVKN